jgi:hypothetical protein
VLKHGWFAALRRIRTIASTKLSSISRMPSRGTPVLSRRHLALGATRMTLFQRRPSPLSDYLWAEHDISEAGLRVYREMEQAILAEQNSTNLPRAEESLKRANQLDPKNILVIAASLHELPCTSRAPADRIHLRRVDFFSFKLP